MPTSLPFHSHSEGGFTLVEMLVVLAIMALGALLLLSRPQQSGAVEKNRTLAEIQIAISDARQEAIRSGQQQRLSLASYDLRLAPAAGNIKDTLIFWPDGSSNGGALQSSDGKDLLKIGWRFGRVEYVQ